MGKGERWAIASRAATSTLASMRMSVACLAISIAFACSPDDVAEPTRAAPVAAMLRAQARYADGASVIGAAVTLDDGTGDEMCSCTDEVGVATIERLPRGPARVYVLGPCWTPA